MKILLCLNCFLILLINIFAHQYSATFENRWITREPKESLVTYAIYIQMTKATDGFCSGSVLTDSWVLTAARCFYSDQNKIVETKETVKVFSEIYNKIETEKHQERDVDRLDFPEGSVIQMYYGPALLKVDKPFILFDSKTRIEVIDVTHYGFGNAEDQNCKIESYGYSKWTVPTKGTKLKSVGNYIETCNCSEGIKKAFIDSPTNTWICGHSEFMFNLCKGDFGAGLICDGVIMGIFVGIIGLDSDTCTVTDLQSKECEKATNVNVFVDVCYHLHWIHALIPAVNLNSMPCDQSDSAHFSGKHRSQKCTLYTIVIISLIINYYIFNR
uniref:Peptidase S1 domain-containing protein n=1 Tax=Homalodisca liturata TaxID=320908 RepID=A0A1B6K6W3_9HEMI